MAKHHKASFSRHLSAGRRCTCSANASFCFVAVFRKSDACEEPSSAKGSQFTPRQHSSPAQHARDLDDALNQAVSETDGERASLKQGLEHEVILRTGGEAPISC